MTSKNKPCEADASRDWNLPRGTSHCPAAKLLAAFERSASSPAGVVLILVLDRLYLADLRDVVVLSATCRTDVGFLASRDPSVRVVSSIEHH